LVEKMAFREGLARTALQIPFEILGRFLRGKSEVAHQPPWLEILRADRLAFIVRLKPSTEIGGFTHVVATPSMGAFDEVDMVHHPQKGEMRPDLSLKMVFPAFSAKYGPPPSLRPAAFVLALSVCWRSQP
jgi:hypothetical protein